MRSFLSICLLLTLLITTPLAAAVEPTRLHDLKPGEILLPDKLPPPIILDNLTIPAEAVALLQNAASHCENYFGQFSFDTKHLTIIDLNSDTKPDYILSTKGYICTDPRATYRGASGEHYYFLISSGPNQQLQLFPDNVRAYDMRIAHYHARYPVVVLTTPCTPTRKILKNYGETHLRWRRDHMAVILRNHFCLLPGTTTPPPALDEPDIIEKPPENPPCAAISSCPSP